MNTVELILYGAGNAFGILGQVMGDVTQEQADWTPPGTANPIGGLYWHTIASADMAVHGWGMGAAPLSESAGWRDKALVGDVPEKGGAPSIRDVTVDLEAMKGYAAAVQEATMGWLSSLETADLERTIETPVGELNLAQMLELFLLWHINAHCGEIAAMKGCQGGKGYPF